MRINTNISALNTYRFYGNNNVVTGKSLEKLSSGQRINRAADDAAGLAISEKMRAQIRGLDQASRNIQDGISMLQVADGGMNEIQALLQRGRELAVQASNGTLTQSDKQMIQGEADQTKQEINRIATSTEFNTIKLLNVASSNSNDLQVITALKSTWLEQAENIIQTYYGLTGDGASLNIVLDQASQPYLAAVSFMIDGTGKAINQELHIDMNDFLPATLPNGGTAPFYDDRIIAHEMVHAVMGRTMNIGALPTWFLEGTAEFIHGADERLFADSAGGANFAAVEDEIAGAWGGTSIDYSAAYAAVRYLHSELKAAGGSGIDEVMAYLNTNQTDTLDDAITAMKVAYAGLAFNDTATFIADFDSGNGALYMASLDLGNADTGAIGGADADGGAVKDAAGVMPDIVNFTDDPLAGFAENWPTLITGSGLSLQVGANIAQTLTVSLSKVDSIALNISNADLVNQAQTAISQFDAAINYVSSERARLGAIQNRLEFAAKVTLLNSENTTASESRIRDVDFAKEMMGFTKSNILGQAASAMLAQANQQPQAILQLLRAS